MKKNTLVIIVVSIAIGLILGYFTAPTKISPVTSTAHMMPNGQMMQNNSMQGSMNSMMSGLQGKTGDSFDQVFLSEMIMHHQGAVAMAQAALINTKHQEIKDLANGIISAQNKEINEMQQWQKDWYNQ